jgi:hypothetical protein
MVRAMFPGMALVLAASISWPLMAAPEHAGSDDAASEDAHALAHARVEVSISARQASFYHDGKRVATYPIGVGKPDWPTRTGEWRIYRIDFNPDWRPPAEKWAEERSYTPPGHRDNPMGRVRMVYDPPRSIHGTDDRSSIGGAKSHGSIRISNSDGLALARQLMEASGQQRSEKWFRDVQNNRSKMVSVRLSHRVTIRVRP